MLLRMNSVPGEKATDLLSVLPDSPGEKQVQEDTLAAMRGSDHLPAA